MIRNFLKRITTVEQRAGIRHMLQKIGRRILYRTRQEEKPRFIDRLHEFHPPFRLHLGCGNIKLDGFCNVDAMETVAADAVDDIRDLRRFPSASAKEIYACHVLEHFSHDEVQPLLIRWFDVLQPGGTLRISVPDIDRIVRIYHKNFIHFETPGHSPWIGLIYGGQSTPYDFHKTGFNACWLKYLLEQCGYVDCAEYPHEPHFVPGTVDASVANAPFGEYFSLNMMAKRPLL
jgi:predicted SAM-dependent methyltransferase